MEKTHTLLLIDDERDFLFTMQIFFESAHFKVITALGPHEGLEKARLKPDLILLDLSMPDMDGFQVCRHLKEDNDTKHIPIIMLTLRAETFDKVTAFDLGVADYMGKSFSFDEILARVKAVLRSTSSGNTGNVTEERNMKVLELRNILDKKDIRAFYQPIIDLSTKIPIGYEGLSRGPAGTFFESPVNLFSFASESDMLFELDSLCRDVSVRNAGFLKKGQLLFLNADPVAISTSRFQELGFLNGSKISPEQVCIEITERTYVKNLPALSKNLKMARSMGVKLAIDDVGEGYSSLNAVAELKPEFIKVDISIVRNIHADSVKCNLVHLIAGLSDSIGSSLVAEGIETEDEYRKILSLGVKYGQGYLFAKPSMMPTQ